MTIFEEIKTKITIATHHNLDMESLTFFINKLNKDIENANTELNDVLFNATSVNVTSHLSTANKYGQNPLHYTIANSSIKDASTLIQAMLNKTLPSKQKTILSKQDTLFDWTPLHYLTLFWRNEAFSALFTIFKQNIDHEILKELLSAPSLLYLANAHNPKAFTEIVNFLTQSHITLSNDDWYNILSNFAKNPGIPEEQLKSLLEKIDWDILESILKKIVSSEKEDGTALKGTILTTAIQCGNASFIRTLLSYAKNKGWPIEEAVKNASKSSTTPILHEIFRSKNNLTCSTLLDSFIDILDLECIQFLAQENLPRYKGTNILYKAALAYKGHLFANTLNKLHDKGVDVYLLLRECDERGFSPLHYYLAKKAIPSKTQEQNALALVRILDKKQLNDLLKQIEPETGLSLLYLAIKNNKIGLLRILLPHTSRETLTQHPDTPLLRFIFTDKNTSAKEKLDLFKVVLQNTSSMHRYPLLSQADSRNKNFLHAAVETLSNDEFNDMLRWISEIELNSLFDQKNAGMYFLHLLKTCHDCGSLPNITRNIQLIVNNLKVPEKIKFINSFHSYGQQIQGKTLAFNMVDKNSEEGLSALLDLYNSHANPDQSQALLTKQSTHPSRGNNFTALGLAIHLNKPEMVKKILKHAEQQGILKDLLDAACENAGMTPRQYATSMNKEHISNTIEFYRKKTEHTYEKPVLQQESYTPEEVPFYSQINDLLSTDDNTFGFPDDDTYNVTDKETDTGSIYDNIDDLDSSKPNTNTSPKKPFFTDKKVTDLMTGGLAFVARRFERELSRTFGKSETTPTDDTISSPTRTKVSNSVDGFRATPTTKAMSWIAGWESNI